MQQSPRRLKLNYYLSDHGVNALHWLAAYALSRPTRPGVNSSLLLRLVSYAPSIKRSGNPPPNPCLKTGLYFAPARLVQTPPPPPGLPSICIYPAHNMPIGYDLAVRPFKAVYLSTAVAIKVSRLPKSLLLAWTGPRRTILIVMVSIEYFPVRHWTILSL